MEYQLIKLLLASWIPFFLVIPEPPTSTHNSFAEALYVYQSQTKSGTKYNDLNADGNFDAGEPGLAGWTIEEYTAGADMVYGTGDDVLVASDVTDGNGD